MELLNLFKSRADEITVNSLKHPVLDFDLHCSVKNTILKDYLFKKFLTSLFLTNNNLNFLFLFKFLNKLVCALGGTVVRTVASQREDSI